MVQNAVSLPNLCKCLAVFEILLKSHSRVERRSSSIEVISNKETLKRDLHQCSDAFEYLSGKQVSIKATQDLSIYLRMALYDFPAGKTLAFFVACFLQRQIQQTQCDSHTSSHPQKFRTSSSERQYFRNLDSIRIFSHSAFQFARSKGN